MTKADKKMGLRIIWILTSCLFFGTIALDKGNTSILSHLIQTQQRKSITGVVIDTRTDKEKKRSLLITASSSSAGKMVDEIRIELPKDAAAQVTAGHLPSDWTMTDVGREISLSGTPFESQQNIYIRVDVGSSKAPPRLKVKMFSQGSKVFDKRIPVSALPPLRLINSLEDLVLLPSEVSPGENLMLEVLNPKITPSGGNWTISGVPAMEKAPISGKLADNPRLSIRLPESLTPGNPVEVAYTDPWGQQVVHVPSAEGVQIVPPLTSISAYPTLTACQSQTFPGEVVCVCGVFPNEASWSALTIDGEPLGFPASASSRIVHVQLPMELEPGSHIIAGNQEAGFSFDNTLEITVLVLNGEIDQDALRRGQSTTMRLWVEGTQDAVSLKITNNTPGIISLEGGNSQVVTTSGGLSNSVERVVQGISPGDFHVDYALDIEEPCPCVGGEPTIETGPQDLYLSEPPKCDPCEEECLEFSVGLGMHISITRGSLFTDVPVCRVESAAGSTIDFWLHYDSGKADGSIAARQTMLGYGWTHNYNIYLVDESSNVFLSDAQGRMTRFRRQNDSFVADPGETHELTQPDADTFLVKEANGTIRVFKRSTQPPWEVAGEFYQLTEITQAQGRTTILTYDQSGRLSVITGPFGRQVTLNYNGNSNFLSTVRNVDGAVTEIQYKGEDLSHITDPLGHTLEYTYDTKHRLLTEKRKDGSTWTCVYNSAGKPSQLIDKDGEVLVTVASSGNWAVDHNKLDQSQAVRYLPGQVTATDGVGNTSYYSYDENGYIVGIQRPDTAEITYQYDDNLRLSARTDEAGNTWRYERDQYGNATRIVDPLGNESQMFYEHDIKNLMTKKIEPDGDVWLYQYDSQGNLTREIDPIVESPKDRVMTHTYNAQGLRTSTVDRNGHRTQWEYSSGGMLITQIADPSDLTITTAYTYDSAGRLKDEIMYRGPNLTDPVITRYVHDTMGRLVSRTVDPDGLNLTTQYRYDSEGRVIFQVNPRGISTEYKYDVKGQLRLQIADPGGLHLATESWYDGAGNLIKLKDPQGYETQYSYDRRNQLVKIIDAEGYWIVYEYDERGNRSYVKRSINPGGPPYYITQYKYDELSRRTREIVDPSGLALTTEFEYAISGTTGCACGTPGSSLIHKTIDAMGKVTYQYYDSLDRLTHIVRKVLDTEDNGGDADDAVTRYEYDFMGNQTKVTVENAPNPNMVVTYTYDAADRLIEQVKGSAGSSLVTTSIYDGAGNVIKAFTALGNVITNVYDQSNRLIEQRDKVGMIGRFAYDENGNILIQTDGLGRTQSYTYDNVGRRIEVYDPLVETPSDKHTTYIYDKNSNLIQQTENEGLVTAFTYDGLNRRLTETRDPGGLNITITRAYDGLSNLTQITDDNGNQIRYEYDSANRRVREIFADGTDIQFQHDASGNLIRKKDQMDNVTTFLYDDLHRPTGRIFANGNADAVTYDRAGNMLTADNNHSHIGYTYDDVGRVVSSTQADRPQTYSYQVHYTYSLSPNQRTIQYPRGKALKEVHDVRGRLVEISIDGAKTTWYKYENPSNRVLTKYFANGTKAEYVYNDNDWVTGLRHIDSDRRTFAGFAHDYDAVGNRLNAINMQNVLPYDDAKPVTQSEMYSYDAIYRLVDFKRGMSLGGEIPRPTRGRTWKLDGAHNWTQFDIDNKSYTNSVNKMNEYNDFSADRMTGPIPDDNSMEDEFMSDKSSSGRNFAHDKNGNRISDDILEYYYDYDHRPIATPALRAENRLTMAKDKATGDSLGEYFYDAFGRRIKKQAGGISTVYVYTYGWRAIEEYEGNVLSRSYTYGQWIDEVLTMDRTVDGDRLYYHVNALGSVIALTDSTGLPVEGYSYDAYGQPLFFDSSGTPVEESTIGNPYLFTGRRYDTETGWYYYRSRYLDPIAGRFMTRDTIGIWGDAGNLGNPYTYIANNPANGSDPLGLIPYVNMYVNPRWEATKGGSDITVNDELKHGAVTGVTTFKAERGYHFKYISALLETVEKGNQIIYTWSKPEETYIKIGQVHCITFKGEGCHERCPMAKDYYIQVELRPKVSYVKGNKGVAIHEAWHVYQVADIIYKALKNVNYVEWCNTPDKALKLCEEKVTKLAAKAINTAIFDWNKHHTSIHNIEKGKYSKDPVEVQAREMAERGQWPPEVMRPPEYYKGGLR